jgi:ActR/RegA family two-component response regulator
MPRPGLLLSDDLLFISRITGTARSVGLDIEPARSAADLLAKAGTCTPACVLIDLQNTGLDIVALVGALKSAGNAYLVAYGSHVDTAALKAAREAGCDLVLPRSKFVEDLATELLGWSKQGTP